MRVLDRSRPYGEIFAGYGGDEPTRARFSQDGIAFDGDGRELDADQSEPAAAAIPSQPVGDLHWKRLKVLVENYGGVWTNREDALAFLNGQG